MACLACFLSLQLASRGSPLLVKVVFVGIIAAILGGWAIRRILSKKRTHALADAAVQMGLTFVGNTRPPYLEIALFSKGAGHKFENIMEGERSGLEVRLFDYSFVAPEGRGQRTYTQTVATFSKEGISLPGFELRPANLLNRAWDAVVHKDIHFESDPEFARHYVLQGAPPESVRELFTPSLISFLDGLDAQRKCHVEGLGSTLVIYRADQRVAPEQMRDFLEQTTTVASTFLSLANIRAEVKTPS